MVPNSLSLNHHPSGLANAPRQREWPDVCIFDQPDNIEPLADALLKIGFRAFASLGGASPGARPAPTSFSAAIIADSVDDHLRLAADMAALCPVLFIASEVTAASRIAAARVGVDGILLRPLDVNELAEWLNDLVGVRQRRPLSILIVDDDEALAETYALALQNAGMRAVVATNPAVAFDQIAMAHIDLVLMDIQMPDVSGIELARAIRQSRRYRSLPIVFLSAERDPARRLEARQLGGDDFIAKPVQLSRLVSLVRMRATRAIELQSMMDRDSLTGLLNHGRFIDRLHHEFERCKRTGAEMSLALLDLDHFKNVNDSHGHIFGDHVLRTVARVLSVGLRQIDVIGRYGGEEFAIILLDTPPEAACAAVDKLRRRFSKIEFQGKSAPFFSTFSGGVCGSRMQQTTEALITAADEQLYRAKAAGRDRMMTGAIAVAEAPKPQRGGTLEEYKASAD